MAGHQMGVSRVIETGTANDSATSDSTEGGAMGEEVNLGILGAGKMAYWHLRAYRALPGVRIRAICNPRSERGRKLALKFRIPNVFRDPEELFRLPELDGVDICVPTGLHKELICRAIQEGLHVYTEKPMCLNIEEADEIVEMNRRLGKIIFVGYNLRFCPEFLKVKEVLASGELGDVKYIWIQRGAWLNTDSYIFNPEWNAGIITELSSHALDLLRWWGFLDVEHVYAEGTNVFAKYPQPDTVCLNIKFQNGAMAVVANSYGARNLYGGLHLRLEENAASKIWEVLGPIPSSLLVDSAFTPDYISRSGYLSLSNSL
jgi:myo-inositol 2-dehydrogenase/D-chiro-inositol 1-dehydrogenase